MKRHLIIFSFLSALAVISIPGVSSAQTTYDFTSICVTYNGTPVPYHWDVPFGSTSSLPMFVPFDQDDPSWRTTTFATTTASGGIAGAPLPYVLVYPSSTVSCYDPLKVQLYYILDGAVFVLALVGAGWGLKRVFNL